MQPVSDVEVLREQRVACFESVRNTPGILERIRQSLGWRMQACVVVGGGHFEQLILTSHQRSHAHPREGGGKVGVNFPMQWNHNPYYCYFAHQSLPLWPTRILSYWGGTGFWGHLRRAVAPLGCISGQMFMGYFILILWATFWEIHFWYETWNNVDHKQNRG